MFWNQPKKPMFLDIRSTDPHINVMQPPENDLQQWALGSIFKMVHQGENKCLRNTALTEKYAMGLDMVKEYH